MRNVTIIGAGQAGLQLGLGLLDYGYAVTIVSDRSPEAIKAGPILSTQCMFGSSLAIERARGLNLWDEACPPVEGLHVRIAGPGGTPALSFQARLDRPALSVDQRMKMPAWMELFCRRGGRLVIAKAGVADLEAYAHGSDLAIVAAGKGEIGTLFTRDETRSPYQKPQRVLVAFCVQGYVPATPFDGVCVSLIPGVGEYFVMPGLTASGPCHFICLEGIPGGPLDCWNGVRSAAEHVGLLKTILARWLPWEYERARQIVPADEQSAVHGGFPPVVRHPIAVLPSGAAVLGLADAVVLNDPITGQGANNAAKSAAIYLERIVARGTRPFDRGWMQTTADAAWEYTQWATYWSNAMLQPPPPHVGMILGAAAAQPRIARWFANGFDNPSDLFPALADPSTAERLVGNAMRAAA